MIELHVDTHDLLGLEKALVALHQDQMPYATARALNDCARAAAQTVNRAMTEVFDRPTPFTMRAAVAPRGLAASKQSLRATVTLRDIQAKYLRPEEEGGARSPADNTRRAGKALVLPSKSLELNAFGNIPAGTLAKLRQQAQRAKRRQAAASKRKGAVTATQDNAIAFLPADAKGNKAKQGGYFRRLPGHRLARLTIFKAETSYKPRMGYHDRVTATFTETWPAAIARRLAEAIRTKR